MCKYNYAARRRRTIFFVWRFMQIIRILKARKTLACHFVWRHNLIRIAKEVIPAKIKTKTAKVKALLEEGTLNSSPGKVRDPKFQENEFFDPRDLVQVKYEMLRRVSVEKASVTQYETLRAAALGNALPPEARAGL